MKFNIQISIFYTLLILLTFLTSCSNELSDYTKIEPAQVEHIEGRDVEKIMFTEKAAERIGIKTSKVKETEYTAVQPMVQKVVPYAAVLYDIEGKSWVYTNPDHLIFIREEIIIDRIKGDRAFLKQGPPKGTRIVIQGASELLGTEFHVGH